MRIQSEPNPIGIAQTIPQIEEKIKLLIQEWNENISSVTTGWRESWGVKSKASISLIANFLLSSLDELIVTISVLSLSGPDKKATVLSGLDRLYDYVLQEGLPIWLRPFASVIKQYVIYCLASAAIDYIVLKYKNGSWRNKTGG